MRQQRHTMRLVIGAIGIVSVWAIGASPAARPAAFLPGAGRLAAQAVDEVTVQLGSDAASIARGECTRLRWRVGNVTAVRLDGMAVAAASSRSVCPEASRTFVLEWRRLDGAEGRQEHRVTVAGPTAAPPGPDGPFVAYAVPAGTVGNQPHDGPLGMAFDVAAPIAISHLGAFDSGQNGLMHAIRVAIYDRDAIQPLVAVNLIGRDGELDGGSRFVALDTPLSLAPGFHGAVVATGYGSAEPNGNGIGGPVRWTTNDGGGLIAFTGTSVWGYPCGQDRFGIFGSCANGFPLIADSGPHNRYAAGTFKFTRR